MSKSALEGVHLKGQFGDYENKDKKEILNIYEVKDLLIVQLVQYKNSSVSLESINIDNLRLNNEPLNVTSNDDTRILWVGPKNWLIVSVKKDLIKSISEIFEDKDFAWHLDEVTKNLKPFFLSNIGTKKFKMPEELSCISKNFWY